MLKFIFFILVITVTLAAACGSQTSSGVPAGKTIATGQAGNLTATIANDTGVLRKGKQDFTLTFTDASGKTVDVGSASVNFRMPAMGSMSEMNNRGALTTTSTPGVYKGIVDLEMSGEWQAQIAYEGSLGNGKANLPITAQ